MYPTTLQSLGIVNLLIASLVYRLAYAPETAPPAYFIIALVALNAVFLLVLSVLAARRMDREVRNLNRRYDLDEYNA